eukprot:TRINITY_DN59088_c0_g1_i1.p1 TRINITY_DN59088_c0_g1~~TRINITY_DN59088_c0_g1_i1.p1  ORF type:complete len:215 (-),score=22.72 TRINITY_DN59088_c0_g1_i1:33-644(-)
MVEAGRSRCPSATLYKASAEEFPFSDSSFDLVTITQVLVYVPDPAKALNEASRVLKSGGRLLILDSVWSQSSWSGTDLQLQHRILVEFDKHCTHPLLPMRIPELLRSVGLQFAGGPHAIPITNIVWDDAGFGKGAAANIVKYVTDQGLIEDKDAKRWMAELEESGRKGTFFFNINRYVFVGVKGNMQSASDQSNKRQRADRDC